eukprot:TRINITY_DN39240_c0_g1_i1.p1 TRINITY_DN39240_c0_g1~~TRINITY_DN39240_c0_g1_i1.p1  ORF type:complete len:460 (-),score=44.08 TRINITY_DN39240_c0_g1_i1:15-1394(-)
MEDPFCEGKVQYCTRKFPFADVALSLFQDLMKDVEPPLEELHKYCGRGYGLRRRITALGAKDSQRESWKALHSVWKDFVRDVILPYLGEDWVAFEREPNLRVHFANQKAPVSPHCDADHFHSPFEVNFWVPLVDVSDSESLWAESQPGLGDYHPFVARYGEAVRFYGNRCQHFTVDNVTQRTRVSFDVRVIRGRDVAKAQLPLGKYIRGRRFLLEGHSRFTLFGYYGIMSSEGELDADACQARGLVLDGPPAIDSPLLTPTCVSRLKSEDIPKSEASCSKIMSESSSKPPRARSSSLEHTRRCAEEAGSAREAQRRCARCGWLANRANLSTKLVYKNAEDELVPWVAENPDLHAPWGLGCIACVEARRRDGADGSSCSFANFAFGRAVCGTQPLLVKALLRHGNHASGQRSGGPRVICPNAQHRQALEILGGEEVQWVPLVQKPPKAPNSTAVVCQGGG